MVCERCGGSSFIRRTEHFGGTGFAVEEIYPCPNPLCHAGQVACCDGLQEQPCEVKR